MNKRTQGIFPKAALGGKGGSYVELGQQGDGFSRF